jgi:hypothetical protein
MLREIYNSELPKTFGVALAEISLVLSVLTATGADTATIPGVEATESGLYQVAVRGHYPRWQYPSFPGSHFLRIGECVLTVREWSDLAKSRDYEPATGRLASGGGK